MTTQRTLPFSSLLLGRAEVAVNRWIVQSTAASDELHGLEGRSMILDVVHTNWRIELSVSRQRLRFREVAGDAAADIVIRAGMLELIAMSSAQSLSQLGAGEVEFRGSLRVAERFSRMLRLARPEIEDEVAGWIGSMPARVVTQMGDAALAWGMRTSSALERDAAEYLQAEANELPRPGQVERLLREVERLRDDVDRLGQRIERLAGRVPGAART
jgi:ubiquinone biosynthesis protein UbiJ